MRAFAVALALLSAGCGDRVVELFGDGGMDAATPDSGRPDAALVDAGLADRDPERCGIPPRDCEDYEYCVAGQCVCRPGLTRVVERCVDTLADGSHCGGVNVPCGMVCAGGACVSACPADRAVCVGGCVDLDNDPLHCGECERKCGTSAVCVAGECMDFRPADCAACPCACPAGTACCTYPTRTSDVICVSQGACPAR